MTDKINELASRPIIAEQIKKINQDLDTIGVKLQQHLDDALAELAQRKSSGEDI